MNTEPKFGEWVSVETPPKTDGFYLVSCDRRRAFIVFYSAKYGWHSEFPHLTHWMPLPPPPPKPDPFEEWWNKHVLTVPGGWTVCALKNNMRESCNAAVEWARTEKV